MGWLTKRDTLYHGVSVNDRIQLDVGVKSYLSRVKEIKGGELRVAQPLDNTWQDVRYHERVTVSVFAEAGFRCFSTRFRLSQGESDSIVVLDYIKDLGSLDRRQHDRVVADLPIRYRANGGPVSTEPWCTGTTSDVSTGGLRIICDSVPPKANGYLDCRLVVSPDEPAVQAVCQVAWAVKLSPEENKPCFGAHFAVIQQDERERVASYVRNRRAWLQEFRRQYDRAPAELPVRYRRRVGSQTDVWRYAVTSDISGSGLRITDHHAPDYQVGDTIELQMTMPGEKDTVKATAGIMWTAFKRERGEPSLGAHFDNIGPADRERVINYVQSKRAAFERLALGTDD